MTPAGGLRKRARPYLNVPSATVADGRLSFKARGILAYLLDKPDGWDVRSVAIAAESEPDGKAAVQSGLRELARYGYYRIERRRLLDGRLVTGTAASEEPVAAWAAEYAEYQGPVPVVQQPDGSFQVQREDGRLTGDGFTARAGRESLPTEPEGADGVGAGETGTQFSGAGSAGAGSAGAGKPGAITNTDEPLQKPSPQRPSRLRRPAALPAVRQEGERADGDPVPPLEAVVAEVRRMRPEWSSRSIRRALTHPDVAERGWESARSAMLAVAADPQTHHPGRVACNGSWWNHALLGQLARVRPAWCGQCSDAVWRQVDVGGKPARCPACHPLVKRAS